MKAILILLVSYLSASLTLLGFAVAYSLPAVRERIISEDPLRRLGNPKLFLSIAWNSAISTITILVLLFGFGRFIFYDRPILFWRHLAEAAALFVIYDFSYYFAHRYLFHGRTPLRRVHAVHHSVGHPHAIDSLMLHPLENVIGLFLFFASAAILGGVHFYVLLVLFAGYTTFNIVIHGGVAFSRFPLSLLGLCAVRHDLHHQAMNRGNYSALTPLPDMVFRTVEKRG